MTTEYTFAYTKASQSMSERAEVSGRLRVGVSRILDLRNSLLSFILTLGSRKEVIGFVKHK